jgi:hypothetical protein
MKRNKAEHMMNCITLAWVARKLWRPRLIAVLGIVLTLIAARHALR